MELSIPKSNISDVPGSIEIPVGIKVGSTFRPMPKQYYRVVEGNVEIPNNVLQAIVKLAPPGAVLRVGEKEYPITEEGFPVKSGWQVAKDILRETAATTGIAWGIKAVFRLVHPAIAIPTFVAELASRAPTIAKGIKFGADAARWSAAAAAAHELVRDEKSGSVAGEVAAVTFGGMAGHELASSLVKYMKTLPGPMAWKLGLARATQALSAGAGSAGALVGYDTAVGKETDPDELKALAIFPMAITGAFGALGATASGAMKIPAVAKLYDSAKESFLRAIMYLPPNLSRRIIDSMTAQNELALLNQKIRLQADKEYKPYIDFLKSNRDAISDAMGHHLRLKYAEQILEKPEISASIDRYVATLFNNLDAPKSTSPLIITSFMLETAGNIKNIMKYIDLGADTVEANAYRKTMALVSDGRKKFPTILRDPGTAEYKAAMDAYLRLSDGWLGTSAAKYKEIIKDLEAARKSAANWSAERRKMLEQYENTIKTGVVLLYSSRLGQEDLQKIRSTMVELRDVIPEVGNKHLTAAIEKLDSLASQTDKMASDLVAGLREFTTPEYGKRAEYLATVEDLTERLNALKAKKPANDVERKALQQERAALQQQLKQVTQNYKNEIKSMYSDLIKQADDLIAQNRALHKKAKTKEEISALNKEYRMLVKERQRLHESGLLEFKVGSDKVNAFVKQHIDDINTNMEASVAVVLKELSALQNVLNRAKTHQVVAQSLADRIINAISQAEKTLNTYSKALKKIQSPKGFRNVKGNEVARLFRLVSGYAEARAKKYIVPKEAREYLASARTHIKDKQVLKMLKTLSAKKYRTAEEFDARIAATIDKMAGQIENIMLIHPTYLTRIGLRGSPTEGVTSADAVLGAESILGHAQSPYLYDNLMKLSREARIRGLSPELKQREYKYLIDRAFDFYLKAPAHEHMMTYKPGFDFINSIVASYALPIHNLNLMRTLVMLRDVKIKDRTHVSGVTREANIPLILSKEDLLKFVHSDFHGKYVPVVFPTGLSMVHRNLAEFLDMLRSFNITGSGFYAGSIPFLGPAWSFLKRHVFLAFSVIHYKALMTAAYGVGMEQSLAYATKNIFKDSQHQIELIDKTIQAVRQRNLPPNIATMVLRSIDYTETIRQSSNFTEKIAKIPIIGHIWKFNKEWEKRLWDYFFFDMKLHSVYKILTDKSLDDATAVKLLNGIQSAYGGNIDFVFMKRNVAAVIRLLLFAPDWYLTITRHFTKSLTSDPLFEKFFQRILTFHFVIANALSEQLSGESTVDAFARSGDPLDLFKVHLYALDKSGQVKKIDFNIVGFEIEGIEFLGILPLLHAIHDAKFSGNSIKVGLNRFFSEYSKILKNKMVFPRFVSTKHGEQTLLPSDIHEIGDILASTGFMPIILSSLASISRRDTTSLQYDVPSWFLWLSANVGARIKGPQLLSEYTAYLMFSPTNKEAHPDAVRHILNVLAALRKNLYVHKEEKRIIQSAAEFWLKRSYGSKMKEILQEVTEKLGDKRYLSVPKLRSQIARAAAIIFIQRYGKDIFDQLKGTAFDEVFPQNVKSLVLTKAIISKFNRLLPIVRIQS